MLLFSHICNRINQDLYTHLLKLVALPFTTNGLCFAYNMHDDGKTSLKLIVCVSIHVAWLYM